MLHDHVSLGGRSAAAVLALALLGVIGFGYRYLGLRGFPDDHFVHLVRSQQVVLGEWPVRDFTDAGAPLTVLLSAAAMAPVAPDDRLWAEAILTCTGFGIAAVLIALVTRRLGAPWGLGVLAGLLAILARPRTYAHPKLWIYAAVLLVFAWYAARPSAIRRLVLACAVVFAFLLRYDHGLYVGIAAAAGVATCHGVDRGVRAAWLPVAQYIGMGLVLVAPYLVYLERAAPGGLSGHLALAREVSTEEGSRTRMAWPRLVPSPLDLVGLGGPAPTIPVNVRWSNETDAASRARWEQALGLTLPRELGPSIYQYELENATAARQAAVHSHPAVVDTAGIDRSLQPGAIGAITRGNAAVLLYYGHFLLAAAAFVVGVARLAGRDPAGSLWIAIAVSALLSGRGFLRDPLPERIADVFGTLPILMAAVMAVITRRSRLALSRAVVATAALVSLVAASLVGQAGDHLEWRRFADQPQTLWARAGEVTSELRVWPWRRQWPAGDEQWPLVRYIRTCTSPEDRVIVTWHAPHLAFISQRRFAGTESVLMPAVREPAPFEARLAAQVAFQAPPVALVSTGNWEEFAAEYPHLAAFLTNAYDRIALFEEGGPPAVEVRVRRDWRSGAADAETGWPCRAGASR